MITDERLKPRVVFTKHDVLGFSKHDHELLGATKKKSSATLCRLNDHSFTRRNALHGITLPYR